MPSLRELQVEFATALFVGGTCCEPLLSHCAGTTVFATRGLDAYRSSVLANLSAAVISTYPVVESIVGHDFLAAAARRYALERPSTSGDLNAFGHDFDDFLQHDSQAATLPYLPDVARLEWLVQQVYGAADAPPQDLSLLATTPAEEWGMLCFQLDPGHACLASLWPIAHIWKVNQTNFSGDFLVDFNQAQTILVHRRSTGIQVEELNPGEHEFLLALKSGLNLESAVESAARAENFDLQATLQRFIGNGLLRQAF